MVKKPPQDIENEITRQHIESLQEESMQNTITLKAVPTATVPLLEDNTRGVYDGVLYERKGSTIYVVTPSSTITIT